MDREARRRARRGAGAALVVAALVVAALAGCARAEVGVGANAADAMASGSSAAPEATPSSVPTPWTRPTTSTSTTTTTTVPPLPSVPPPVAVDGDPGSGNRSAEPASWVQVSTVEGGGSDAVVATNRTAMAVQVRLTLTRGDGVWTEPALPLDVVVDPGAEGVTIARIGARDPSVAWSYDYSYTWALGAPVPAVPPQPRYEDPLPAAARPVLIQGPGGTFSHDEVHSRHAIDWAVPVGTPVLAARAGVVGLIDQGYTVAGGPELADRGNQVIVVHDDGTFALYVHIDPRSARVRMGDRVTPGQVIALSGHNGFSDTPHLHFGVNANIGHVDTSVPVEVGPP